VRKKILSLIINLVFILPILIFGLNISSINATAASSCTAPSTNTWDISQSVMTHNLEYDFESYDLEPLIQGFSHEVIIENDSSTAISMELIAGYRYNFCISFNPSSSEESTIANGDIYLMTGSNWDIYKAEYLSRSYDWIDDREIIENIPVEWRDMVTWLPFRDVHAYENIEYREFSVGIDSSGSSWSSILGGNEKIEYYLVLDGFDNKRLSDSRAAGNNIDVEIIVEVEKRIAIPIFTAYLAIGALPVSCIIVPIILHIAYKNGAKNNKSKNLQNIPLLEENKI
tara:strand:+ start:57299 stop:58153 length:855 start_codon:yes stop_codon:yes gene_type:complete